MGAILDRIATIQRRASQLGPLAERVRTRHERAHRAMIAAGQTETGAAVAPVAPATLARRRGQGPPRAPRGLSSRVAAHCEVVATVDANPAAPTLRIAKRWPGFSAARYLHDGTRRMPARPMGLRPVDRDADRADLRRHVLGDATS